ncbi:hypothetical protein Hte_003666 [Hypoxylon texense]
MEREAPGQDDGLCTSAYYIGRKKCRYHLDRINTRDRIYRQRKKEAATKQAEVHTGVDQHGTNTLDVEINTQSNVDIDVDMDDTDADMNNNNNTTGNVTLPSCRTIFNSLFADKLFNEELNFAMTLPPIVGPLLNSSTDPKAGH